MAKEILPITVWVNGILKTGNSIEACIVNDNLQDYAQFLWEISEVSGTGTNLMKTVLERGNVTISGVDYTNWGTSIDINLSAYEYICNQLNLTLKD